jgi:nucleotide-binding universal stress UspA family protein
MERKTSVDTHGVSAGLSKQAKPVTVSRRIRQSYEAGHRPKLLVLVDDTPDCEKAIYYASRRAARLRAQVILLRVIEPPDQEIGWLGVSQIVRTEARQEAQTLLNGYVDRANAVAAISPETVLCEGDPAQEILKLIQADEDISILVLAAGSAKEGPGRLVSDLAHTAGTYPIPIVIVPAHLTDRELNALS